MIAITKTKASELARNARRCGYYRNGRTISVFCPQCKQRIEILHSAHAGTIVRQLDVAVVAHLLDDCEDTR